MILAGLFAAVLFIGLLVGDWFYFVRLTPDAIRYGCRVARSQDRWTWNTLATVRDRFTADGVLMLPHGVAWFYPDLSQIAIRPQYRLFSMSFRTAWPIKGLIQLSTGDQTMGALCVKRIPWSSALITLVWFVLVTIGSLTFVITYAMEGGFTSLRGVLWGAGIIGIALLVLAFGLVTVVFSYRLENSRLTKVYDELREVLEGHASS
ncbi:MAG: hypothetical protein EWM72_02624 [Nitrospira sp.]|nr:MAG: hypothetical protein EWM72_02624 [Nitrospira sp.]